MEVAARRPGRALPRRREKTGRGDALEVPLAAGLCDCLVYNSMDCPALAPRYHCLREIELERRKARALPLAFSYKQIKALLDPFYHTYACSDGRPFYVVAPCHAIHQKRCLEALGVYGAMVADGLPEGDVYAESEDWTGPDGSRANCVLGTYPISDPAWLIKIRGAMAAAFARSASRFPISSVYFWMSAESCACWSEGCHNAGDDTI